MCLLSGLINQYQITMGANGGCGESGSSFREGKANGYTWTQNDDEVELRFPVAAGTKAKYVKVNFGKTKLKVMVAGQTLLSGLLGGSIEADISTFTIEHWGKWREIRGRLSYEKICPQHE